MYVNSRFITATTCPVRLIGISMLLLSGELTVASAQPTYAPQSTTMIFVSCVGWPGGNPTIPASSLLIRALPA